MFHKPYTPITNYYITFYLHINKKEFVIPTSECTGNLWIITFWLGYEEQRYTEFDDPNVLYMKACNAFYVDIAIQMVESFLVLMQECLQQAAWKSGLG